MNGLGPVAQVIFVPFVLGVLDIDSTFPVWFVIIAGLLTGAALRLFFHDKKH